jgi:hypothetical protein
MAAPHVGGGGALYLSNPPKDPDTGKLLDEPVDLEVALKNAVTTPGTQSKNGDPIKLENVSRF